MKKNFLVTTGLIDTWEFSENNFVLGKWCEFYETNDSDSKKYQNIEIKDISIIKNEYHWNDEQKRNRDYLYIEEKLEEILEIISNKLSVIHNINENKKYWRVIIHTWLTEYFTIIFDKWESARIFFKKNKDKEFYTNFISLNDLNFLPKNHLDFVEINQMHEWNHLIFLRIFNFLNFSNLSLLKKEVNQNKIQKEKYFTSKNNSLMTKILIFIDKILSKLAFKFNKVVFESFYFPKKEYLKICLKHKLIPSRYINFFEFDVKENNSVKKNKRTELKELLLKVNNQDNLIKFFLLNLHKDIPKSFIEDFDEIRKKFLKYAKNKKIIISMTSLERNDNFKIYLAETKKMGSQYIHVMHGAGLPFSKNEHFFDFFEKISDKIINANLNKVVKFNKIKEKDFFINLSPTLPIIKFNKLRTGDFCTIIFVEQKKYIAKFPESLIIDQSIDFFNEVTQFVKELNPEIKSKIKFRAKDNTGFNSEKKFSKIFGQEHIDKISAQNSFKNALTNSKLIIAMYPQTSFSEALYCNVPTVLIIKKSHYQFTQEGEEIFNLLKKNKIAYENFSDAKIHINKHWKTINTWWQSNDVQNARKKYLLNFFNVKENWYNEWSDYVSNLLKTY